jgi:myo-inositol-1(or 4)-monophosphatase
VLTDRELAIECSHRAGKIIAQGFHSTVDAEYKGSVDPVTTVDRAAETAIRSLLAAERPGDDVLGEEQGGGSWNTGRVWIVDPLDGTVNFIHRLPHIAVSVALWEEGLARIGVVYDVMRGELFCAEQGAGATLDEGPLTTSPTVDLGEALIATGFPYDRRQRAAELAAMVGNVLAEVQGIRRMGSAALDLCYVACGRFDGYWEAGLHPWDTAAGCLIVREAGGQVTDLGGGPHRLDSGTVIASNGHVHDRLRAIVGGPS